MRLNGRTGWIRTCAPGAIILVMFSGAVRTVAAPSGGPPAVQPAVSLPQTDILDPDKTAAGQSGGAKTPVEAESSREIHRPPESSSGGMGKNSSTGSSSSGATTDGRLVGRQTGSKGLWGIGDFVPLAIVLTLVGLAAWAVKRYLPARRLVTGAGVLEIVARLPLSPKQSLVLVKMGRRMVLVGVSPERVNTVCLVDDPEQVAELVGRIASQTRDSSSRAFGQSLDGQAEAFDEGADEEPPLQAAGGVRGLLEKVRRLSKSEVA